MPENNQNMQKKLDSVAAVIPAHNEQGNIAEAIEELLPELARAASFFEIIVVDDGSSDKTGEVVSGISSQRPEVKLVRHGTNRGYGAALRSGFSAASKEWIFFTDGDRQFDPAEFEKLVGPALSSGFAAGVRENRRDPPLRKLYGAAFSSIMRLVFGVRARDVNCAFKLFRADMLEGADLISEGALINTELFIAAAKKGITPAEVPVSHRPRQWGEQSGGSPRVILRAIMETAALIVKKFTRP